MFVFIKGVLNSPTLYFEIKCYIATTLVKVTLINFANNTIYPSLIKYGYC